MVDVLPKNVILYENSSLLSWNKTKDIIKPKPSVIYEEQFKIFKKLYENNKTIISK